MVQKSASSARSPLESHLLERRTISTGVGNCITLVHAPHALSNVAYDPPFGGPVGFPVGFVFRSQNGTTRPFVLIVTLTGRVLVLAFFSLTLSPVLLFAPAKILHLNRQNRSSEATKNVSKISPHSVCEISLRLSECMWVSTGHSLPAATKPAPKRTRKTDRRHKRTPRPPNHRKSKSPIQPPLV